MYSLNVFLKKNNINTNSCEMLHFMTKKTQFKYYLIIFQSIDIENQNDL